MFIARVTIAIVLSLAFPFINLMWLLFVNNSVYNWLIANFGFQSICCVGGFVLAAIAGRDAAKFFWVWALLSGLSAIVFMAPSWDFKIFESLYRPTLWMVLGSLLVFVYYKISDYFLRSK